MIFKIAISFIIILLSYLIFGNIIYYILGIGTLITLFLIKKQQNFTFSRFEMILLSILFVIFIVSLVSKSDSIFKLIVLLIETSFLGLVYMPKKL